MEEKVPLKSAMVSRLPKFGARPSGSLSNGTPQTTPTTQEVKTTPSATCTNGVVRASFSLKWRRDGGNTPTTSTNPEVGGCEDKSPPSSTGKEVVKSGAPGTPRLRRSGPSPVATSSPKAIPKQTSKLNPKAGTKIAQSPLNGSLKSTQNGSMSPTRPGATSGSESRLARPRAGSGSHRSSSQDSLPQSSDGLKTLAPDNMVRSHSFTHFKQIPSPTSQPMIRSFSFNRAVELAKPLANTQLRPPRGSFLKPPQLSSGRVGLGLGGLGGGLDGGGGLGLGFQHSRTSPTSTTLSPPLSSAAPTPTTPSALKKPLLPSCVLNKPSGSGDGGSLSYKLSRPVQARQQKPLFTGRVKGDIRPLTATGSGAIVDIAIDLVSPGENEKADPPSNSDCSSGIGGEGEGSGAESSGQAVGEALEDMSLSSASSLERGDTSEEFLDDFESVGDGLSDVDLPDNRKIGSATQSRLRNFLSETMDWANMGLAGHKEEVTRSPLALSSDGGDFLHGSSLELSPSNSSGGTYMWDEEGLEPLGGPHMLPCDGYDDSELNSMDILNNLDSPGPDELDDDDLMLDVDLPEDSSLHLNTDGMAHLERSERAGRQGHWRRKQHRWNGADHFHNDNRAPVYQQYDGVGGPGSFKGPPRPLPAVGGQDEHSGLLDELTLKHMAQDCGSLKNQLLRLKSLLQLEDTGLPADVAEESEDNTAALQMEELMKEVRVLRNELRSRDKTIDQLTLQCKQLQKQQQQQQLEQAGRQGRCQCHHQRAPSSLRPGERQMDRRTHYDKATQTHWRGPGHTGVLAAPLLSPWQAQYQGSPRTSMPQRRHTSNTTAFQHLPHRAPAPGKTSKNSPHRGPQ